VILDVRDPASIRAWLAVWPERHRAILRWLWRVHPDHRATIEEGARA